MLPAGTVIVVEVVDDVDVVVVVVVVEDVVVVESVVVVSGITVIEPSIVVTVLISRPSADEMNTSLNVTG